MPSYALDPADLRVDLLVQPPRHHRPASTSPRPRAGLGDVRPRGRRPDGAARSLAAGRSEARRPDCVDLATGGDRLARGGRDGRRPPRDPHSRVEALASSRRVVVSADGTTLADSRSPILLFETTLPTRFYLPEADLVPDVLTPSSTRSHCPYKGFADRYWSIRDRPDLRDIAWSYARPYPAVGAIAGRVAFYNELLDITVDGVRLGRPSSPFSSREQRPGTD